MIDGESPIFVKHWKLKDHVDYDKGIKETYRLYQETGKHHSFYYYDGLNHLWTTKGSRYTYVSYLPLK